MRALVEATARILESEGPEGLNTNHIAEVAGVSVGSLYQYFPTKEALVAAVVEARLDEDAALFTRALEAPGRVRDRVVGLVPVLLERQASGGALMAGLLPLLDHVQRESLAASVIDGLTREVRRVLLEEPDALRPDLRDPERLDVALYVLSRTLRLVVNAAVVERPGLLLDPAFVDELQRVTSGLFGSMDDPGSSSG